MSLALEFELNGQPCRTSAPAHFTLLDLLRDGLALLGTKDGCGEGVCGACTVLLDGDAVSSCLLLSRATVGREIETAEHVLTQPDSLGREVLEAFVASSAFQCSYCIPAMALTVTHLLARDTGTSSMKVREALGGNLCRCGSYPQIMQAVGALVDRKIGRSD